MSDFKAKMHQIRFSRGVGLRCGSLQRSLRPLAVFKGPTSKGKEGRERRRLPNTANRVCMGTPLSPLLLCPRDGIGVLWWACLSVCLCVCLSVHDHIFGTARPIFTEIFVHATYGCGSVLFWRRADRLCTSGFMDDVIFAHKPRWLDVAAQLKRSAASAHAPLCLSI